MIRGIRLFLRVLPSILSCCLFQRLSLKTMTRLFCCHIHFDYDDNKNMITSPTRHNQRNILRHEKRSRGFISNVLWNQIKVSFLSAKECRSLDNSVTFRLPQEEKRTQLQMIAPLVMKMIGNRNQSLGR